MIRDRVLSARVSWDEVAALERIASRNSRTVAGEMRAALRRHVAAEVAETLPLEALAALAVADPANATPSEKSGGGRQV